MIPGFKFVFRTLMVLEKKLEFLGITMIFAKIYKRCKNLIFLKIFRLNFLIYLQTRKIVINICSLSYIQLKICLRSFQNFDIVYCKRLILLNYANK